MKRPAQEDTARVIVVALALWGIAVAAAAAEGVFAKLSDPTFTALAAFATLYAPLVYRIDRRIREFVQAFSLRQAAIAVAGLDVVLVSAWAASLPWALLAFFGVPLAAVAHYALAERALGHARSRRIRSAAATSPGARRAAT